MISNMIREIAHIKLITKRKKKYSTKTSRTHEEITIIDINIKLSKVYDQVSHASLKLLSMRERERENLHLIVWRVMRSD